MSHFITTLDTPLVGNATRYVPYKPLFGVRWEIPLDGFIIKKEDVCEECNEEECRCDETGGYAQTEASFMRDYETVCKAFDDVEDSKVDDDEMPDCPWFDQYCQQVEMEPFKPLSERIMDFAVHGIPSNYLTNLQVSDISDEEVEPPLKKKKKNNVVSPVEVVDLTKEEEEEDSSLNAHDWLVELCQKGKI